MKRPMMLAREIESVEAKIAERRRDRARIDDEILDLIAIKRAKMTALVGTTVERWDLSEVSVETLMQSLSKITHDALHNSTSLAAAGNLQAFVRFGRNASASNREKLVAAGLHWNGREGGWVGRVTEAQIADLRDTFGGRLEKPEVVCAQDDPGMTPDGALEPLSSNTETIVTSYVDGQWPATAAFSKELHALGRLPPPAGFPHRRFPVT